MKKIFVAMVAAAMVLGGCTKGEMGNTNTNEMATVTFTADANTIDVRTRAGEAQTYTGVIGINYDGTNWEVAPQADVLGFENELSSNSTDLIIDGLAVDVDGETRTVQIKSTGNLDANFYSVAVAEGAVEVSAENTVALGGADATSLANDVIWASYATPVNGSATVPFAFKHVMAKVRIEIYEKSREEANKLTEGVEISGINNLGIVRNGSLNLLTGDVEAAAEATVLSEAAINTEYFVLPQKNVGLGKSFTVKYQDKDYTVALAEAGLDFNANKCRVISLLVTGSGITFTATLEDWADEVSAGNDFNLQ